MPNTESEEYPELAHATILHYARTVREDSTRVFTDLLGWHDVEPAKPPMDRVHRPPHKPKPGGK